MRHYSHFFSVLYDESGPVGNLGRGAHYSVIRILKNIANKKRFATFHDIAIIWDEDHDTRVITAIEQMILGGIFHAELLFKILFIGERKGVLSVIFEDIPPPALPLYEGRIEKIANELEDPWTVSIKCLSDPDHSIIFSSQHRVQAYLHGIDALWGLGRKPAYIDSGERSRRGCLYKESIIEKNRNFDFASRPL